MGEIINLQDKRIESIEKKRRAFERVVFKNLIGTYTVLDEAGSIHEIIINDISQSGIQFQVPIINNKTGQETIFQTNKKLDLRFYFTKDSYIQTEVVIKRKDDYVDEFGNKFVKYGCEFVKTAKSFEAIESFINFLSKFAEHSVNDRGDSRVYFI